MTAVIALVAFAACWLALCPLVTALHRFTKPLLDSTQARPRAAALLALAVLPLAVATLVALLGFAPAVGGLVVDQHCHPTTGCATHVPAVHADALYGAALALVASTAVAVLFWSIARRLRRSLRIASSLHLLAEQNAPESFELIDSPEPFAYCIGLFRPRVVLSRGLVTRLPRAQLDLVLRHERAHAERLDNLRLWVAGIALLPLPTRAKQSLLADLALAGEQVCDSAAAVIGGNALVIETLDALAAHARPAERGTLTTFGSAATVVSRIEALRRERYRKFPVRLVHVGAVVAYTVSAVVATDVVHHATELLLAAFV